MKTFLTKTWYYIEVYGYYLLRGFFTGISTWLAAVGSVFAGLVLLFSLVLHFKTEDELVASVEEHPNLWALAGFLTALLSFGATYYLWNHQVKSLEERLGPYKMRRAA